MSSSYQLTQHPVGSKREFWAMTWPLMIGLISSTLMMFIDRLFLAHFDPLALNAAASGGIAYYMFLVIPMGIASISEVLVGRLHGENRFSEIGSAAWQMVLFSLLLLPVFSLIGWGLPSLLFAGTGNELYETSYFQTLMWFAPIQCIAIALSGFFIGTGNIKIVTFAAILGNMINISLDYLLIFGWGSIPALGVMGGALGTGLSQVIQVLLLMGYFWNRTNRKTYQTQKLKLNRPYLLEGLKIGTPAGLGHCMETTAHFLFFRIVMSVGSEQMTLVAMVQSFYILSSFVIDSQSKASGAIAANLLGAKMEGLLSKVLRSSFILHSSYFILFVSSVCLFPQFFFKLFASEAHTELLNDPILAHTFLIALFFMCIFFLLDGLAWILIGFLTAAGDTRFVFLVSSVVHWVAYVAPAVWLVGRDKGGADVAWGIIAGMSLLNFVLYAWRYRSGLWFKQYSPLTAS